MEYPLPFKDGSFEVVWASHVLEHRKDLRAMQQELARITKQGGELNVIVPYYLSSDAWGDPTHCRAFSEESFFGQYWPGFLVRSVDVNELKTKKHSSRTIWIFAKLARNEMPMREVNMFFGKRVFNK